MPNFYSARFPDFVVSQLAEVGITVDLQTVEFPTWIEQVYTNHDYDLTYVIHVEPRDLDNYANPEYYWLYDNPEVQERSARRRRRPTPKRPTSYARQAAEQIATDAPAVWLYLFPDLVVTRAGVSGMPEFDVQARFDACDLQVAGD